MFRLDLHCASLSSFPIVEVIPLPTWAALRANSDRAFRSDPTDPFASRFCTSDSNDVRCDPTVEDFCLFCA